MIGRNRELYDSMIEKGFRFRIGGQYEHFIDYEMNYVEYPIGYIRGPHFVDNGNPRPYQMSVKGKDGWLQMGFTSIDDAKKWAIEQQEELLST